MNFQSPFWLYAAAAAALAILVVYALAAKSRRAALDKFASAKLVPELSKTRSPVKTAVKNAAFLLGVVAVMIAMARPQYGYRWEESRANGVDVVFAVDVSKSMLAEDVSPNRLERAKLAILDISEMLRGDRVGLVAFSGQAFLQCPLTLDYDAFRMSLDALDTNVIQRGGTNIAAAITEAESAFAKSSSRKILVLISDGEELESSAVSKAQSAAKDGVVIYTLGVGGTKGEAITISDSRGRSVKLRDENGEIVRSRLNEDVLRRVAEATGGFYEKLSPEGVENVAQKGIAKEPKSELSSRMKRLAIERFQIPLAIGIILLALETLVGTRRYFRRSSAAALALLLGIANSDNLYAQATETSPTAEAKLQAPAATPAAEKTPPPETARDLFNAALKAYKDSEFSEAQNLFDESMKLEPADFGLHAKALYNSANAEYKTALTPLLEAPTPQEAAAKAADTRAKIPAAAQQSAELIKRGAPLLEREKQMLSQAKDDKQKAELMKKSPLKDAQFQQQLKQAISLCKSLEGAPDETAKQISSGESAWKKSKEIVDTAAALYADALLLDPQFADAAQNEKTAKEASQKLAQNLQNFAAVKSANAENKKAAQKLAELRGELEKLVRDDNQNNQNNQNQQQNNNQNQQNQNSQQNQQNNQNQNNQQQNQPNQDKQQNQDKQNSQNSQDNKDKNKQDNNQSAQDKQNKSEQNKDNQNPQDKNKENNPSQDKSQKQSPENSADKNNSKQNDGEQKDEQAVENKNQKPQNKNGENGAEKNADKKPENKSEPQAGGKSANAEKQEQKAAQNGATGDESKKENFRKAEGVMTKAEAKQLLDSMKDGEKILPLRGFGEQKNRFEKSYKDW